MGQQRRGATQSSGYRMSNTKSKPSSVDEYIAAAPEMAQKRLREMRRCLRQSAPDAEEGLKWGSPAFSYGTILFIFAAHKNHISLYPTPSAIRKFAKELEGFRTSSSTVQFPLDESLPLSLIRQIADFRVRSVVEDSATWM
jgi:uncharacterized protein YdhG (YjbR/CyaY superfamily)